MKRSTWLSIGFAVLTLIAASAAAQLASPGIISITWSKIAAGGGSSSSASFAATSTIGQLDAGTVMSGGTFTMVGGFWPGAHPACFGDLNNNGAVNIEDLLGVIASCGICQGQCPSYCPADVS